MIVDLGSIKSSAIAKLDVVLFLSVISLQVLGVAFIYSSGITSEGYQVSSEWIKQIVWSSTGLILMTVFALVSYRFWRHWAIPIYAGITLLLILVLIFGDYIRGARAWIGIGGVGVQPSEFAKLSLIMALAWWFEERRETKSELRSWLGAIVLLLIPVSLVLIQPDLGTAIVFFPVFLVMSFSAGIGLRLIMFPVIIGVLVGMGILGYAWSEYISSSPSGFFLLFKEMRLMRIALLSLFGLSISVFLGWLLFRRKFYLKLLYGFSIITISYFAIAGAARIIREYQLLRLVVFLKPQIDPQGAGWNTIQSVTAIGSGGISGKGFLKGTQSHYRYLPEQSTDFIFSILAEELGFIGSLLVFVLYSIVIIRALRIAYTAQDRFGAYIAIGIAAMLSYHVIQNIGMAIGLLPITGIPLFFLSYGGSASWTALISVGLLLSIHYRRHEV